MKSGKGLQQEDEVEDEELAPRKDALPCNNSNKVDGKNSDKASAVRSKHSVTEQRRRCKINERFQILRNLVPHSDKKRDTASFLMEVIQYVQYLQEKVQKYEESFQPWSAEPTKLTPWGNSHWRIQSFAGHAQAMKNNPVPGAAFPGRLDESNVGLPSVMQPSQQIPIESDPGRHATSKIMDAQTEITNKEMAVPLHVSMPVSVQNDATSSRTVLGPTTEAQSTESPVTADALNHQEELVVEGGTISISSVYSQGLLNSLTEALQSAGVDLSQATISVQINLGKRASGGLNPGTSVIKDHEKPMPLNSQLFGHRPDRSNGSDLDQAHKRLKTQDGTD